MYKSIIRFLSCMLLAAAGIAAGVFLLIRDGRTLAHAADAGVLTVDLLKVGKADAIILQCEGRTMVIDTGEEDDGEELVDFLKDAGVNRVDYLLITHFDKDHVGGADTLLESMETGLVLVPAYKGNSQEYFDFMDAVEKKKVRKSALKSPVRFFLGTSEVIVEPPADYVYNGNDEADNNFSLITMVSHGDERFLFTGDAMKSRIREWLSLHRNEHYDFLKVPHHGVYSTAQKELAEAVTPCFAAICSSRKHPADEKTVRALRSVRANVLETKNGNIHVISNGEGIRAGQDLR